MVPKAELREETLLADVKSYVQRTCEALLELHEKKGDPIEVIGYRTAVMDELLGALYRLTEIRYQREGGKTVSTCLVSQGGYGRKELCLHSDIDILLLFDGRAEDFIRLFTEMAIQCLWDAGLEIGFASRTIRDCRKMMEEDLTILTSLIDLRVLAGDRRLEEEFHKMFRRYFEKDEHWESLLKTKMEENRDREGKYGGSVYLLEPNLKEGEGGLRDFHTLYWLARVRNGIQKPDDLAARGILSAEEVASLWEALKFLWKVRNELHRRAGRRLDQLLFEHQEALAHWMGYENTSAALAVERFMQSYYTHAAVLHRMTYLVMRRMRWTAPSLFSQPEVVVSDPYCRLVEGRLAVVDPELFHREPLYLLKVFHIAREVGAELDDLTRERIQKSLGRIDDDFRSHAEAGALFRTILSKHEGLGDVLASMNELGVLGAFLPEFQKLHFKVQHDAYHVYTVDVHSIFAVGELSRLATGDSEKKFPFPTRVLREVEKNDLLAFATLYHDIGKGEGSGHVEKGAPLIRKAGERIGFSPEEVHTLEFLERSHLIMTHLAFRRDLEDQNLIIQFARTMGGLDHLNMLYLQTFCDVKGVSAEAMTGWKASLLEDLYRKTREVIERGAYTKEKVSSMTSKILEDVLQGFEKEADKTKCREFFLMMPPRYLLATPPASIQNHVQLWERFGSDPIVFEARVLEKEGLNEVTVLTLESAALFSVITGIFASHSINILEASLNLSSRGHALQIFKVTDHDGNVIGDRERWARIERDLRDVIHGRVKIERLVDEKFKPSYFRKKIARRLPSRVEIDNDVSAYYTVIDIYTNDRIGLLYQITTTLWSLGLYVDVSKISTKVDQVADTFYVRDIFGHKITSEDRLKRVKSLLQKVLEEEPAPGWRPPSII